MLPPAAGLTDHIIQDRHYTLDLTHPLEPYHRPLQPEGYLHHAFSTAAQDCVVLEDWQDWAKPHHLSTKATNSRNPYIDKGGYRNLKNNNLVRGVLK